MIQREKLILLRKEKGLTQMQVAEEINVSRQAISGWETGAVVPSIENLKSLSVLYGVPVDHLLSREGERLPTETTEEKESKERRHKLKKSIDKVLADRENWAAQWKGYVPPATIYPDGMMIEQKGVENDDLMN